jgi:hypothetical protein
MEKWRHRIAFVGLLVLVLFFCLPYFCRADEPWYYCDPSDYRFIVPDKMQHFYGCYGLTLIADWPAAAVLAVSKECFDAADGQAFSKTDLVADALGIAAALLNHKVEISKKSPRRFAAALDWRPSQQEIVFVLKFNL